MFFLPEQLFDWHKTDAVLQREKCLSVITPWFHPVRNVKIVMNLWNIRFPLSVAGEGLSGRSVEVILAVTLCILSVVLLVAAVYAFARWDLCILAILCLQALKNVLKKSWNSPINGTNLSFQNVLHFLFFFFFCLLCRNLGRDSQKL